MLKLATSEKYPIELPAGHRFPFMKYELVRKQLEYEGLIQPKQVFDPEFVTDEVVEYTHCPEFWSRAKNLQLTEQEIRAIGFPQSEKLVLRSLSSASGTVRAAENALSDGAGMNLAGGTHHAFFDRGEGFCLLNDVAIASNYLLRKGLIQKALVLDLDVHQGNGTAALFAQNPQVFTFSVHCADNYPFEKETSDWDIDLPAGTGDLEYLQCIEDILPSLIERIQPDIVFYVAGVDVLESDKLGKLSLSLHGCYRRDKFVVELCKMKNLPLVAVMGGGYPTALNTVIRAHCNTYKVVLEYYEKSVFRLS